MSKLHVGLVQLRSGPNREEGFAQAESLIRQAANVGATLVATPENTTLLQMNRAAWAQQICAETDDPYLPRFRKLAKELGISLVIGSLPIKVAEAKAANRSFLITADGAIAARYDKIHLFDVAVTKSETWRESDSIQPGHNAVIAETQGARLGFSICYDLRFPQLYQKLAKAGANILLVPAAFTRPTGRAHWHALLRARAIETGSFVLAPAQGGVHEDGRKTYGHSLIVDPWGKIIAELDHDEPDMLVHEINLAKVDEVRRRIPAIVSAQAFTGP